mmetsp:Transcript_39891/g.106581  ORF Transcript_39891/g.106581 Transcript_39891/m.106581 type:complete len:115 (-) Transcript_39891:68-412(-)
MLLNIGGRLFAVVPAQSLEAGPEFFNSWSAPHNCVGGSEQGCTPGKSEAYNLFKDPSKMNREVLLFRMDFYIYFSNLRCFNSVRHPCPVELVPCSGCFPVNLLKLVRAVWVSSG